MVLQATPIIGVASTLLLVLMTAFLVRSSCGAGRIRREPVGESPVARRQWHYPRGSRRRADFSAATREIEDGAFTDEGFTRRWYGKDLIRHILQGCTNLA